MSNARPGKSVCVCGGGVSPACPFLAVLTEAGGDVCDLMSPSVPGMDRDSDIKTSGTHSGPEI